MVDLIGWAIFGLVAGVIAKLLVHGKDPGGCVITMLLGVAGAVVGGFIARILGVATAASTPRDRNFMVSLAFAVIGAVVILVIYRLIAGKRA